MRVMVAVGLVGFLLVITCVAFASSLAWPTAFAERSDAFGRNEVLDPQTYVVLNTFNGQSVGPTVLYDLSVQSAQSLQVYLLNTTMDGLGSWMNGIEGPPALPSWKYSYGNTSLLEQYIGANGGVVLHSFDLPPGQSLKYDYTDTVEHNILIIVANPANDTLRYSGYGTIYTLLITRIQALLLTVALGIPGILAVALWARRRNERVPSYGTVARGGTLGTARPVEDLEVARRLAQTARRWCSYLRRWEAFNRFANAAMFGAGGMLLTAVAFLFAGMWITITTFGWALVVGILVGLASYIPKRNRPSKFQSLMVLAQKVRDHAEAESSLENSLALLDGMLEAFPDLSSGRYRDAWIYGTLVWFCSSFTFGNLLGGLPVASFLGFAFGAVTLLFLVYEADRLNHAEREVLNDLRKRFEDGKTAFMDGL